VQDIPKEEIKIKRPLYIAGSLLTPSIND